MGRTAEMKPIPGSLNLRSTSRNIRSKEYKTHSDGQSVQVKGFRVRKSLKRITIC